MVDSENVVVDAAELQVNAGELNEQATHGSARIETVDKFLHSLDLGIPVKGPELEVTEVREHPKTGIECDVSFFLTYGQDCDGAWAVLLNVVGPKMYNAYDDATGAWNWVALEREFDTWAVAPLSQAPRHFQFAALSKLPLLLEAINKKAKAYAKHAVSDLGILDKTVSKMTTELSA